jgi:hypothetical protein
MNDDDDDDDDDDNNNNNTLLHILSEVYDVNFLFVSL